MSERAEEMKRMAQALLTKRAEVVYIDGTQIFGKLHQSQAGIAIDPDAESRAGEYPGSVILDFEAIKSIIPAEAP
jgi:hypothetical protein